MEAVRILLTGDYRHDDFRSILEDTEVATLLVPLSQVGQWKGTTFDLVVVTQSRRGQIGQAVIEEIRCAFPLVPIINLLGSWCEGVGRSGSGLEGVKQVFWHQWSARFDQFVRQVRLGEKTAWQAPATATAVDQVQIAQDVGRHDADNGSCCVAVDAATEGQFEMLAAALVGIGCQSIWMSEQEHGPPLVGRLDLICIDALSLTDPLLDKVADLRERFADIPLIVLLNFPRRDDVANLRQLGVSQVVAKPFRHGDLHWAVDQARYASVAS
ncbi:MAG: hypothetical protein VYE64_10395 [Planctomycetota bacterium]|nr:hypothetical protein [Planctomycetota bacterium]